jgi:hypothetical protein
MTCDGDWMMLGYFPRPIAPLLQLSKIGRLLTYDLNKSPLTPTAHIPPWPKPTLRPDQQPRQRGQTTLTAMLIIAINFS